MVYSSRLYEELKTFIWHGNKAQAQKGKNDDLVLALAIGIWLYDTSPVYNSQATHLNDAMLKAMQVNVRQNPTPSDTHWANKKHSPFIPIIVDHATTLSGSAMGDLSWLM
jgi:hypothetical protein